MAMKLLLTIGLFLGLSSFNFQVNSLNSTDEHAVQIAKDRSEVCQLKFLGKVQVQEKWWFYNQQPLKATTIASLVKLADNLNGDVIYIHQASQQEGFALFTSNSITAEVYARHE